jgi:hypothetical protein
MGWDLAMGLSLQIGGTYYLSLVMMLGLFGFMVLWHIGYYMTGNRDGHRPRPNYLLRFVVLVLASSVGLLDFGRPELDLFPLTALVATWMTGRLLYYPSKANKSSAKFAWLVFAATFIAVPIGNVLHGKHWGT